MFNLNVSREQWELLTELKNVIFIILILIDFLFILTITFFDVSYYNLLFMALFDLFICVLLFLQLCNDYKHYDSGIKSFLRGHVLDIIAMIPFNFIFLRYLAVYRIVRLIQVFQVIKVFSIFNHTSGSLKFFIQNRLLKILMFILLIYLVVSSIVLNIIDPSFTSVFEAFWFNIVTITSVGYGDLAPITDPGKVIAMFSIIMGLLFVSIFTAYMSSVYMEKPEEETRKHFKNQLVEYNKKLESEREELYRRIDILEKDNKVLNEKLDSILELLEED